MTREPGCLLESKEREDATALFLARLFWRASSPLVASLLVSACGPDARAGLEESSYTLTGNSMNCSAQGAWQPMSALRLTQPVDFIALRNTSLAQRPQYTQFDAAGAPCATAKDVRVCQAELERVSLYDVQPNLSHLVYTQGDTVKALQTLEEKLALLGAIDTPDEALLVLFDANTVSTPCSAPEVQVRSKGDGGYLVGSRTLSWCGPNQMVVYGVAADGSTSLVAQENTGRPTCPTGGVTSPGAAVGRRPPNLRSTPCSTLRADRRARYFADAARLEAASVPAFEQLADELRVLGAPRALRSAARSAAEDEVVHAQATSRLAERFGARPARFELSRQQLRGRAEVALDNAVEGCVHETYGAYLATVQARLTRDPELRMAFTRIAADETAHAALAWRLAAWLEPQLTREARRHVNRARLQAIRALGARPLTT